ncbi:hypothetical protein ACGRSR_07550 [Vibrio owensii]|uniref:hypothetical protein n=1 Tax=Vibrio owensii TaxID=696485 RepID=UPI003749B7A5
MKNQTIEAFTARLGSPTRETKKALAWNITSGYGVVVQIDQPQSGEHALVWLPYNSDALEQLVMEKTLYPEDKGRHSNTYAGPGLSKGEKAIRVKLQTNDDLANLISYLFDSFI